MTGWYICVDCGGLTPSADHICHPTPLGVAAFGYYPPFFTRYLTTIRPNEAYL